MYGRCARDEAICDDGLRGGNVKGIGRDIWENTTTVLTAKHQTDFAL